MNFSFSKKTSADKGLKPMRTKREEQNQEKVKEEVGMKEEIDEDKGYNPEEKINDFKAEAQANEVTFER